jgi:hypothetical protein
VLHGCARKRIGMPGTLLWEFISCITGGVPSLGQTVTLSSSFFSLSYAPHHHRPSHWWFLVIALHKIPPDSPNVVSCFGCFASGYHEGRTVHALSFLWLDC